MARPLSAFAARLRRQLLAQPGITPRPVCPGCREQCEPGHFTRMARWHPHEETMALGSARYRIP